MSTNRYNVASIEKAVAIIDYIAACGGATYKKICDDMNYPKASIYTILQTGLSTNLLTIGTDKKYRLGTKLLYWGYTAEQRIDIAALASPILQQLAADLQVSVHMGQMIDGKAIFVAKYDGSLYTIKTTVLGQEAMFHCQCTAKTLLAYQPLSVQKSIISSIDYPAFTHNTITTPEQLERELAEICKNGYSVDNYERSETILGLGVPVFNWRDQVVAAISIGYIGPGLSIKQQMLFIEKLRSASRAITNSLGNITP